MASTMVMIFSVIALAFTLLSRRNADKTLVYLRCTIASEMCALLILFLGYPDLPILKWSLVVTFAIAIVLNICTYLRLR